MDVGVGGGRLLLGVAGAEVVQRLATALLLPSHPGKIIINYYKSSPKTDPLCPFFLTMLRIRGCRRSS